MTELFWSIIFFKVGAVFQILDSTLGVWVYRKWYKLTHQAPLAPEDKRGFVTQRGSKINALWALIWSTGLCLLFIFYSDASKMTKLVLWLIGIPLIMIGFYLGGPALKKLWRKRDVFFRQIDALERGDVEAKSQLNKLVLRFRQLLAWPFRALANLYATYVGKKSKVIEPASPPVRHEATTSSPPAPAAIDPRESIRRYTEGREK